MKELFFLQILLCLSLVSWGQWDEDPFVYDEVFQKVKETPTRQPASIAVPVQEPVKQKKRTKIEPPKDPVKVEKTNKLVEKKTREPVNRDWEKVKKGFERKLSSFNESPEPTVAPHNKVPKKKYHFQAGISLKHTGLNSESSFSPHDYKTEYLKFGVDGNLSLKEEASIFFDFSTNFGGDVADGSTTKSVSVDVTDLVLGYEWGDSLLEEGIRYQVGYRERDTKLAKSSAKLSNKVSSALLGVHYLKPSKYNIKIQLMPFGSYSEESTSFTGKSGSGPSSFAGTVTGEYILFSGRNKKISAYSDFYWESIKFKGNSSVVDPVSGSIVNLVNVRVNENSFGFKLTWQY